ncbi:MAG TPA: response regulator [Candidatus Kapabacteria bacterium]|nr:response regulator [Candidatus Kapabacteria bacterium]
MMEQNKQKKLVLIVDDDVDFLTQNKMLLANEGFEVVTAEGQVEAEKALKEINPDLVISDLMMENFDGGFWISETVKKKNPTTPVILVTSVTRELGFKFDTTTEDERSWIKADKLLNKPIRFEQLLKEVQKLLK